MTAAQALTAALGGRWRAGCGLARCPCHQDETPSLSIRDGAIAPLITCHAGCDRRDILATLRDRGLWDHHQTPRAHTYRARQELGPDPDALVLWRSARPATGSIVECYLRNRGITLPVPPSLRCGDRLHFGRFPMPTMVAAVQAPDGRIIAVQRTMLTSAGNKAAVSVQRVNTGALGNGAVRLAKVMDVLGLAEGVESALSVMQLLHAVPCWAALGAARLHRVTIPPEVKHLTVFADNDDAGRRAAERVEREHHNKRRVTVEFPAIGKDWNDALHPLESKAA